MPDQLQLRGGSAASNDAFTGAVREVSVDTTNNTLRVHDGATVGGHRMAKYSEIPSVRTRAIANATLYVASGGSDSNPGTVGSPFATVQKGLDTAFNNYDLNGFNVTVQLVDSGSPVTWTVGGAIASPQVGAGRVILKGNSGVPGRTIISPTSAVALSVTDGAMLTVQDLELRTTTSGNALQAARHGRIFFSNINFGAIAQAQIRAFDLGLIQCDGNYAITGGAAQHWSVSQNGVLRIVSKTITLSGTPAFSNAFLLVDELGMGLVSGNTYAGTGATGTRYSVMNNAVARTGGATLPGSAAGSTATGGLYS